MRTLVRAGDDAAEVPLEQGVRLVIDAIDERLPGVRGLGPADLAVLRFVAHATLAPRSLTREQLRPLRAAGLDDREIHDVANVVACFSYMNRLADSLGVHLGDDRIAWAKRLLGDEAVAEHLEWGRRQV